MPWPPYSRTIEQPSRLRELADGAPMSAEPRPVPHDRDARIPAAPRDLDDVPRLGRRFSDETSPRCPHENLPIVVRHVDVHDVAVLERLLRGGNA